MTTLTLVAELPWSVEYLSGLESLADQNDGPPPIGTKHERTPRRWLLTLNSALPDVADAIETAHDATKGGSNAMDWAPPGLSSLKVRFLPGKEGYRRVRNSAMLWNITVILEEALSVP